MINWLNALHPNWYMEADKGDGSGEKKDESQGDKSENKEETKSEIDWTKIDPTAIPEDLIKKNPAYKTVLDESVRRRQEIKKLRDDAKKLGTEEEAEDKSSVKKDNAESNKEEIPAWAKQILDEFNAMKGSSLETWKQEAATEYGIKSKTVIKTLEGKTKDEVFASAKTIAEELGIPKPAPSPANPKISVGNPNQQRDKSVLEQAKARMRGTETVNIFDPKVQEKLGGGVQIIE